MKWPKNLKTTSFTMYMQKYLERSERWLNCFIYDKNKVFLFSSKSKSSRRRIFYGFLQVFCEYICQHFAMCFCFVFVIVLLQYKWILEALKTSETHFREFKIFEYCDFFYVYAFLLVFVLQFNLSIMWNAICILYLNNKHFGCPFFINFERNVNLQQKWPLSYATFLYLLFVLFFNWQLNNLKK